MEMDSGDGTIGLITRQYSTHVDGRNTVNERLTMQNNIKCQGLCERCKCNFEMQGVMLSELEI